MGRSIYEQAYVTAKEKRWVVPVEHPSSPGRPWDGVRLTHHRDLLHGLGYPLLGVFEVNQAAGEIVVIGAEIE